MRAFVAPAPACSVPRVSTVGLWALPRSIVSFRIGELVMAVPIAALPRARSRLRETSSSVAEGGRHLASSSAPSGPISMPETQIDRTPLVPNAAQKTFQPWWSPEVHPVVSIIRCAVMAATAFFIARQFWTCCSLWTTAWPFLSTTHSNASCTSPQGSLLLPVSWCHSGVGSSPSAVWAAIVSMSRSISFIPIKSSLEYLS